MNQFNGWRYIKRGFHTLQAPGVKRYVYIPVILNIIILGFIITGLHYEFGQLNHWINNHVPSWLRWLDWIIWLLFAMTLLIFFVYLFTLIANVVAAPFNSLLAKRVEEHMTGIIEMESTSWIKASLASLGRQWEFIVYVLPRFIFFVILSFIPVVNILSPLYWFLFSAWLSSVQYFDYAFDNHQRSFKEMLMQLRRRPILSYSYGSCVFILSFIPIVNLIIVQAAVAGATVAYVEQMNA